ncbi:hypothetical protein GLOIN_2v1595530 [Rhizophagus irregularis DAOM 181602=DAOM 197198]|uniref:Uncharacterized protein n=2 Tax=Rhizophagus irregularis TaxID=588596 RepID=A0A015J8U1_RHIIW|nr:hypothetical protein GLOIN_2v1595530 [Rhizophagus irregularis DAOM 181602=DAOM 197198]EXX51269.1 hypothetical protein RirG_263190 [Rhizophagus irregularis DAOM 197198w]POG72473.1 hypothetical protein GLOIN_2v1595530 [Rhizophagus irregularis DAOM 181602=DAOM 197198]|eukprot:XP_025179339.1 hypothetical protein GLOIN_2v1595530 [Rhizophagus irregularis DAOM 181602=DAOM 197198]
MRGYNSQIFETNTFILITSPENDKVLYMSKLSRKIEHGGQKNLRLLGKVTKHHAIQVKTEKGGQYLIERTSDKDPKDPKSTVISNYSNKNGEWKLKEFYYPKDVTLGQVKNDAFDKKAYNLLTANCQQATRESIKKNSAYSAKNDPNPKVHTTQASTSKPKRKK